MLGDNTSVEIRIRKNDDVHGIFTFDTDSLVVRDGEGGEEGERERGLYSGIART